MLVAEALNAGFYFVYGESQSYGGLSASCCGPDDDEDARNF